MWILSLKSVPIGVTVVLCTSAGYKLSTGPSLRVILAIKNRMDDKFGLFLSLDNSATPRPNKKYWLIAVRVDFMKIRWCHYHCSHSCSCVSSMLNDVT